MRERVGGVFTREKCGELIRRYLRARGDLRFTHTVVRLNSEVTNGDTAPSMHYNIHYMALSLSSPISKTQCPLFK